MAATQNHEDFVLNFSLVKLRVKQQDGSYQIIFFDYKTGVTYEEKPQEYENASKNLKKHSSAIYREKMIILKLKEEIENRDEEIENRDRIVVERDEEIKKLKEINDSLLRRNEELNRMISENNECTEDLTHSPQSECNGGLTSIQNQRELIENAHIVLPDCVMLDPFDMLDALDDSRIAASMITDDSIEELRNSPQSESNDSIEQHSLQSEDDDIIVPHSPQNEADDSIVPHSSQSEDDDSIVPHSPQGNVSAEEINRNQFQIILPFNTNRLETGIPNYHFTDISCSTRLPQPREGTHNNNWNISLCRNFDFNDISFLSRFHTQPWALESTCNNNMYFFNDNRHISFTNYRPPDVSDTIQEV
jgi:hypothetical protein